MKYSKIRDKLKTRRNAWERMTAHMGPEEVKAFRRPGSLNRRK